jgi:hypothetical protein
MTSPKDATSRGLKPHYKIRVIVGGAPLHFATEREPDMSGGFFNFPSEYTDRVIEEILHKAGLIEDYRYGDSLGYISDSEVSAISWRYAP